MDDDFPQFMYSFYDKDGDEVGDRMFAMDGARCEQFESLFKQLAHKKAICWTRWELRRAGGGDITR